MGEELAGSDATRCSLVRQVDHQPCSRLSGRTRPLHAIQLHGTRPGGDWGGLDLGRDLGLAGPNRCRAGRQSRHATISTIAQSLRDVLQSSSPSLRCPRRKARCIPSSVYSRCLMAGKSSPGNFGLLQQYLPTADSCTAPKQHDHSMTSSTSARKLGGKAKFIAFAVLRLISSSSQTYLKF